MDSAAKPDAKKPQARSNGVFLPLCAHKFVLLGGSDRNTSFNDLWRMDLKEKKWEEVPSNISEYFSPRSGVSYSLVKNNAEYIEFLMHGGQDFFSQKFYADMFHIKYFYNDNKISIKNTTKYPIDTSKTPCERNSHCMAYDAASEKIYLFGGGTNEKLFNDLWCYDLNTELYEELKVQNMNIISERELFGMVYHDRKLVIFGGRLMDSFDKSSYVIDLDTKNCQQSNNLPFPVCSFCHTKVNYKSRDYIIIYGGTDGSSFSNNFIVCDLENMQFYKSKLLINKDLINNDPTFSVFLGRISAMISYNPETESIILYGGSACDKEWDYINEIPIKDII